LKGKEKMNKRCLYSLVMLLLGLLTISVVGCAAAPEPRPTVLSFSATPMEISYGDSTTLEWSTSGAKSVTIQPDIGNAGPSGSLKLSPAGTTTYDLTASNDVGNTIASVTVTVVPANVGQPDLVVTDIFCEGCELYYKIKNQGNAVAKPSKSHLYRSGYTTYQTPRAIDWVDYLDPGEEITTTFPNLDLMYYGWCQCYGVYTICVDVDKQVEESNEDNNCVTKNVIQ
jgi:hypothetical protein